MQRSRFELYLLRIKRSFRLIPTEVLLITLLGMWAIFFLCGVFVDSSTRIGPGNYSPVQWFVVLISWAWTNLLFICCIASLIGAAGIRKPGEYINFNGAIIRGFFVYLLLLSGQLVLLGGLRPPETQAASEILSKPAVTRLLVKTGEPSKTSSGDPGAGQPPKASQSDKEAQTSLGAIVEQSQTYVSQAYYFRLTSFASLLGFLVGYRPQLFEHFMRRLQAAFDDESSHRNEPS